MNAVRSGVAQWLQEMQQERVEASNRPDVAHHISVIAVDETEFPLNVPSADSGVSSDRGANHVMMLHGSLRNRFRDGSSQTEEIAVSPAIVADITGKTLLSAITRRCPWLLQALKSGKHVIILCSDSAKSLLLAAKHYVLITAALPDSIFLHARCYMHKLWGAFASMIGKLSIINPMFSATCLTHRPGTMHRMRQNVRAVVNERLVVRFDAPREQDTSRNRQIVNLLNAAEDEWAPCEDDQAYLVSAERSARAESREN